MTAQLEQATEGSHHSAPIELLADEFAGDLLA